jgi:hypothetical protein
VKTKFNKRSGNDEDKHEEKNSVGRQEIHNMDRAKVHHVDWIGRAEIGKARSYMRWAEAGKL